MIESTSVMSAGPVEHPMIEDKLVRSAAGRTPAGPPDRSPGDPSSFSGTRHFNSIVTFSILSNHFVNANVIFSIVPVNANGTL